MFVIDLTERKRAEQERDRLRQLQADPRTSTGSA